MLKVWTQNTYDKDSEYDHQMWMEISAGLRKKGQELGEFDSSLDSQITYEDEGTTQSSHRWELPVNLTARLEHFLNANPSVIKFDYAN